MSKLSDDFPMMMERDAREPDHVAPVAVAFGMYPMFDSSASKKAGHDVYKDVEHVKIVVPGDKHSLYFQPATAVYRERFPKAYAAFKNREQTPTQGLPIEQWAPISRALAMTLRSCHIHTVEALASVHDGHLDKLGFNARELRDKAKAWLAQANDSAATLTLAAEKKQLQDQLSALQAQIAELSARVPGGVKVQTAAPAPDTTADVEQDVAAAARRPRRAA